MRFTAALVFGLSFSCCAGGSLYAQESTTNRITGEWNFSEGDLRATAGSPLQFRGNTESAATFEASSISGAPVRVLRLPALAPDQGLIMPHGAAPNGGGAKVNDYTLLMDVLWPAESSETWRALLQSDTNNANDAIFFVNNANALGVNNVYNGSLSPNQWHRIALVFELSQNRITSFIDGQTNLVHELLGGSRDGEFSLGPTAFLFTDNDGESQPVLINSIQFRSLAMSGEELAQLGGASAGGLSGIVEDAPPAGDVKIDRIQKIGSDVVLTVSGGGNLQLQKSTTLVSNSWQNFGSPAATNEFRVPANESRAFFRIERR